MNPRVFLDSGAYSAIRQGVAIDVHEYAKFLQRNVGSIRHAVNLDIIPDPNMDRDEIEATCKRSYENQQFLKDAGLTPLPVVHRLDASHWLERYLEDGERYICLAPGRHAGAVGWLRRCFQLIEQTPHRPAVHGLGISTALLMTAFRWSSTDSSTWAKQAAVGRVLVPLFDNADQPLYRLRPHGIFVSGRMTIEPNHIDQLHDFQREDLIRFLQQCDLSLEDVRTSHQARCRALITYFRRLQSEAGTVLYFVANPNARDLLLECGARDHLLSYAWLRRQRDGALQRYVEDHT